MLPHPSSDVRDSFAAVLGSLAAAAQTSEAIVKACCLPLVHGMVHATCRHAAESTQGDMVQLAAGA